MNDTTNPLANIGSLLAGGGVIGLLVLGIVIFVLWRFFFNGGSGD
ncbi:hypothetical protein RAS1_39080 [Phycisphaerae bacterium RAS1]|nr:hypothetical protein RAS1_39080 [Phycisphaerae bacterium RAS1]